ncbi:YhjR family protein [Cupriavidus sp. D384]|uniref:YhjR family protein n=1 Tax=Cupriavidus sp. D384 TaxID=1538095 RepID=UPI000A7BF354|nr:YhjR family protein [Cupriavidus sp. D384]
MSARPITKPITSRKAAIAYNDIDALAQKVDGFDGRHYFDQQGEVETAEAAQRWPLLARVMGLASSPRHPPSDPLSASQNDGT